MLLGEMLARKAGRTSRDRRGPRMNSRVPVSIEWKAAAQTPHFEPGHTRVVNTYGCLLISPREIGLGECVRLTNLATLQGADGIVVWKGMQRTDGWELGVELTSADPDFWGLDL